jgi:hypothetical protein|tara:strand:+ start:1289 stop:1819 length:531 start_codon:yes stop_codon:yes gene_type:complete
MSNTYQFKTTNIKGKQYVEVNQRVKAFRLLSEYSGYTLRTDVIQLDPESCVIQATIRDKNEVIVAQGMAQEDKSSSRINQTSYIENCETSAIGRALGFLGIGIETSIATADEVGMAIAKQDAPVPKESLNEIFKSSVEYIKGGSNKPQRAERLSQIKTKYGSTLTKSQLEKLDKLL